MSETVNKDEVYGVGTEIVHECLAAMERYAPMNSAHEGYAVLLEEMDELKAEVWKSQRARDVAAMRAEALQVPRWR